MSFTINTNIASLQAQYYLNQTQKFQAQTINEVTSGVRLVNSGNDPSGLAIANGYRSDSAVLTQGIQNANDGISQLQIADGGISNISQLLDSARTLATEAASGTFTGDRGVLNQQFQSVLLEIDRQAQSIGLNQGGFMAKALNVFIGGGQASGNISASQNGSISIDLSHATVDAKSLGLQGVQATGAAGTDIGAGSATSVQNIVSNGTNLASIANNTTNFIFTGPGFTNADGSGQVKVSMNLAGVTDTNTLVTAINQAIQNAGNGSTQQATAFKNANITASIVTDANGRAQLAFSSATTAFQVQGADQVSTAFLGNFATAGNPIGNVANVTAAAAQNFVAPAGTGIAAAGQAFAAPAGTGAVTAAGAYQAAGANETINMRILGLGLNGTPADDLSVALLTTDTVTAAVGDINTAIAANAAVAATGLQAVNNSGSIELMTAGGQAFTVQVAGDVSNSLGFGSWANSAGVAGGAGNYDYNALTAGAVTAAKNQNLQVSLDGGAMINLGNLTATGVENTDLATLNAAFQGNAILAAAGMQAVNAGGKIQIRTTSGENFRLNFYGGNGNAFGFGDTSATTAASSAASQAAVPAAESVKLRVTGMGLTGAPANDLTIALTSADTVTTAVGKINTAIAANATVAATGLQAVNNSGTIQFTNTSGSSFQVQAAGDAGNVLGFGSWSNSAGVSGGTGTFNYASLTAAGVSNSATQHLQVSLNGGAMINLGSLTGTGVESTDLATLNAALQGNVATKAAGLEAVDNNGKIQLMSTLGQNFRLNFYGGTGDAFGFGASIAAAGSSTAITTAAPSAESVNVRLLGMGLNGAPANDLTVALSSTDTVTSAVTKLNQAIAANAAVAATGVQAQNVSGKITFVNAAGNSFQVMTAGDVGNVLGFGSWSNSAGSPGGTGTFNYSTITANGVSNNATQGLGVSINGAAAVSLGTLSGTGVEATDIATLNAAFQGNAATRAAGLQAVDNSGKIQITSSAGQNFRLNFYGGTGDAFGFGQSVAAAGASAANVLSNYAAPDTINASGAQQSVNIAGTDVYQFTAITNPNASQTVTITAVDANGTQHTLNVALSSANAGNLDQLVNTINQAILSSNDSTLQTIAAFKQENNGATAEGVRFMSANTAFGISLGASDNFVGLADGSTHANGGPLLESAANGSGSTANISNVGSAQSAVNALRTAVTSLGSAQAQVGIGENNFTYAVNLAQSQLTNFQAAESQIRDADLAQESANLTKSQIMLQAGVAALAQANSAPQQVLSLLQH